MLSTPVLSLAAELRQLVYGGDSNSWFDIRPSYSALGLRMDSFVEEIFISGEPAATPVQRARFEATFGSPTR